MSTVQRDRRTHKNKDIDLSDAEMTFGDAARLHMQRIAQKVSIKRRTRTYWAQTLAALLKHWLDSPVWNDLATDSSALCVDSGGEQQTAAQQIEPGASVHLAFEQFEYVDVAFGLAVAPTSGQGDLDGSEILLHADGEGLQGRHPAGPRLDQPSS